MFSSRSATMRMARIGILAAAGDAVTKACAATWLAEHRADTGIVGLALVHNDQAAFGLSFGAYTWQWNLALTLAAVALIVPVCRALAQVDERAPEALGLIAGGALGNLLSLVLSPFGVLDFIAVRTGPGTSIVLNAADLAAYVGLAMLVRTGWRLTSAIAASHVSTLGASWQHASPEMACDDAEVPRAVFVEPGVGRPRESGRDRPAARRERRPETPPL